MFRTGLEELPSEVVLYWFTLCFYGYRQQAGRAALRTLLTYEQAEQREKRRTGRRRGKKAKDDTQPSLFSAEEADGSGNGVPGEEGASPKGGRRKKTNATR
jgi:hypothetical protein